MRKDIKKQLIAFGMASALGVSSFVGGVNFIQPKEVVKAETSSVSETKRYVRLGNFVRLVVGEKVCFTEYEGKVKIKCNGEMLTTSSNGLLRVKTSGAKEYIVGNDTGTSKILYYDSKGKSNVFNYLGKSYTKFEVCKKPTSIKMSRKSCTVKLGKKTRKPVVVFNEGEYSNFVKYTVVSGKGKIKISGSYIKGVKKGTVKLKVKTYNGKSTTFKVKVK